MRFIDPQSTLGNTMSDYTMDAPEPFKQQQRAPTAPAKDLSRQIEQSVKREPLDAVRCIRVFGDFYRCNWWSRLGRKRENIDYDWGGLITDHIRQSRFMKATLHDETLVLEDVVVNAPGRRSIV
jgi:hypothetical protein